MNIKVTHSYMGVRQKTKHNDLVAGVMVKRQPYNILAVYMHKTTVLLRICR